MQEKIVFLFPGQGAQYQGMGKDIYYEYACVRHMFEQISDYAGQDIKKICFDYTAKDLMRPDMVSLTTLTISLSMVEIIKDYFNCDLRSIADFVAGHSMGQYSALCAVDSVSLYDTVYLLKNRSMYTMDVGKNKGGMICVVGLDKQTIDSLVNSVKDDGFVAVANYNLQTQFVISGENIVLDSLLDKAKNAGAKIAKRLAIGVPGHCELMKPVQSLMRESLKSVNIKSPGVTLFSNETADVISNPDLIKEALISQICNGVNWFGIMNKFPKYNITHAYELGPGKVLSGLVNRANVGCVAQNTGNLENIQLVCRLLEDLIATR